MKTKEETGVNRQVFHIKAEMEEESYTQMWKKRESYPQTIKIGLSEDFNSASRPQAVR